MKRFGDNAGGDPNKLDLLFVRQVFGPDRQQKYAHLTHPVQNDRANLPFPINVR